MRLWRRRARLAAAALLLAVTAVLVFLWASPPELIRVGAAYTAKMVCSNVFLAGRDPQEVLASDVQAPGHPLLRLMRIAVDRRHGEVRAGLLGFVGGGHAVFRIGAGCAVIQDGSAPGGAVLPATVDGPPATSDAPFPAGDGSVAVADNSPVAAVIATPSLAGPGVRAIVVLHEGRTEAERYVSGFGPSVPQLGWSMTKTVTAGLIGVLVQEGALALDRSAGWPAGDSRHAITVADLLSMTSGLKFDEGYGAVSDVTRMLYLENDMAAFARDKPLVHPVGAVWSYSSGTALILSRLAQDAAGGDAVGYARSHLFAPLGMTSAVLETDAHGTWVGSSYLYATPRDWARFAQFLLQEGQWQGRQLLPPGWVSMMASPVAASDGQYGHGMVWRKVGTANDGLPADTFWMSGHDGQFAAIVPSRGVVVLRMGLTPEREHYQPEPLVAAVLGALH